MCTRSDVVHNVGIVVVLNYRLRGSKNNTKRVGWHFSDCQKGVIAREAPMVLVATIFSPSYEYKYIPFDRTLLQFKLFEKSFNCLRPGRGISHVKAICKVLDFDLNAVSLHNTRSQTAAALGLPPRRTLTALKSPESSSTSLYESKPKLSIHKQ